MANGQLSHELEVNVPASEAWDLFGTLRLSKFIEEQCSSLVQKIDLVEGDGGVGTVVDIKFVPGTPGVTGYKEKFTKIDNEARIKEAEAVEGGYLDLGFSHYLVRFEIIEKANDSCIIKTTIEYQVKEEAAANASLVSIEPLANVVLLAQKQLTKPKA
ncbi:hypothetical protein UlMin_024837 [Ulmus minor]